MPLLGIDHVELYVGNATQAAYWFTHALGFRRSAYAGLETGIRDRSSHVMRAGAGPDRAHGAAARAPARSLATSPSTATASSVIALSVPDAEHAYRYAVQHGARGVREPWEETDDGGTVRMATVATYGDTLHTFVQRDGYAGAFLPGYAPADDAEADAGLFAGIDHVVGNVELGRLDEWVGYYERVFGMTEMIHFSDATSAPSTRR